MSWIIKGAAAAALDATARTLPELNISGAVLRFQSLAGDSLTWTAETIDATGAGTIIPDAGQIVELWWDSVRKFKGHVTGIRAGTRQISITAEGPWWWLERTNLTSDQTDGSGTTAERPVYVFATGDLQTHLEALIDRAITNGAPLARGTVAASYAIPQATLAEQPCSEALATLLAWCPDSVAWFDYSGSTPALNIGRRGDFTGAAEVTYTIGTDAVEQGELSPRLDLEVTRNELHYVTRNATTGKPEWALQASGTAAAGTAAAGKRQIVAVSGPEIVDFLPKDDFETVTIQTQHYVDNNLVAARDSYLASMVKQYGSIPTGVASGVNLWIGTDTEKTAVSYGFAAVNYQRPDGTFYAEEEFAGAYIITNANAVPDWVLAQYGGIEVTITGTWISGFLTKDGEGTHAVPAVYYDLTNGGTWLTGFINGEEFGAGSDYTAYWSVRPFSFQATLINTEFASPTAVYKAWEYSYLTPPAGLAANLVAAQNWVPWEGQLTLVADDCSGDNLLPAKYHLAGSLPPCAAMGALARGVTHDLMRGRTTIDLGAPARLDFGTLVSRIRREPKDNIVYL